MSNRSTKQEREVRAARPGPFPVVGCVAALAGVLFAGGAAVAQPPAAPPPHLPLDALVKEYKRYGLPFPPANAQLVRINWDLYAGVESKPGEAKYVLGWRVPPAKPDDRTRYLIVDDELLEVQICDERNMVEETKPTPDALRLVGRKDGFLFLAVQCKERGWNDLAKALYDRALEMFIEANPERPSIGELGELRASAWIYWRWAIHARGVDRKEALRQLTGLAAEDPDLRTEEGDQLRRRLKLTVDAPKAKPGTVEALIDELTEYWHKPNWVDPTREAPPEWASYWKLAELGFDAILALIEHVNDERLAMAYVSVGFAPGGSYDVTVGHLCRQLLFNLSGGTLKEDWSWPSRRPVDPDEARKWFEQAKKIGEEKWLLSHAMPPDGVDLQKERWRNWAGIVRVIGAKYPARLPEIYRAVLKRPVRGYWIDDYVNELVGSKLSREQKIALLEEGAAHDDLEHRFLALKGLAKLDQPALRKHLLAFLVRQIPLWGAKSELGELGALRSLQLVEAADDKTCWELFALGVKFVEVEDRLYFIWYVFPDSPPGQKDPHRLERIRFLVQFIDDATAKVYENGNKAVIRDYAASRLAGLLGFSIKRGAEGGTYRPVHPDLGPLTRILFRELMRQTAAQELAAAK